MTVFSNTFDTAAPDGGDDPAEADNNMRRIQAAIQERLDVNLYFPLTGTEVSDADTGEIRMLTIRTLSAGEVAALAANKAYLYRLITDGELYFKDASNNTVKLTIGGILNSLNLAGAQTAAGVKTFGSIPVLPAANPTTANQATRKTYVDARTTMVPAITGAGAGYAGEESVTLPNGMIMKMGVVTCNSAAPKTVTFGTAFPNAIIAVTLAMRSTTHFSLPLRLDSKSTSNIVIDNANGGTPVAEWIAIGH